MQTILDFLKQKTKTDILISDLIVIIVKVLIVALLCGASGLDWSGIFLWLNLMIKYMTLASIR